MSDADNLTEEERQLCKVWWSETEGRTADSEAWRLLVCRLRVIEFRRKVRVRHGSEGVDAEALSAVIAVYDFLSSNDVVRIENLDTCFRDVLGEIHHALNGGKPPLFNPPRAKGMSTRRANLMGLACRAIDELHQAGKSIDEAANETLLAIRNGHRTRHRSINILLLKDWRARISIGEGPKGAPRVALKRFREHLPVQAGRSAVSRADFLLSQLRSGLAT